ncbi:MAG: pyruvate dehydrogenase (acetyl-transferring), homodimeric type, partial [Verrucomicrobia bacterium]|nr:pyruvate dehydrogenase (acetyl-transferring), homodimeric type [Verrucomicrobiota bacterium]
PAMPEGAREGILRGLYKFKSAPIAKGHPAQILGSGAILNEALKAQAILAEKYGVAADVWSVTSYKELHREALETERWNIRHPKAAPKVPYVAQCLGGAPGPIVAASDYVKALPDSICRWLPRKLLALGTDGFGRSDGREALRDFFEVDARHIALATLAYLAWEKTLPVGTVEQAMKDLAIDPDRASPMMT